MGEVAFKGIRWIWANNRVGEGFIEERLDLFFGSAEWNIENDKAEVQHFVKHSSDHTMVMLDTQPDQPPRKSRFIFDNRWLNRPGYTEAIQNSWSSNESGSRMYQFHRKLRNVRA